MEFNLIFSSIKNGGRIRRACWKQEDYIYLEIEKLNSRFRYHSKEFRLRRDYSIPATDILATDWEVYIDNQIK